MLYHPDQVSYKPGSFFQRIKRVAIERALGDTLGIPCQLRPKPRIDILEGEGHRLPANDVGGYD